MSKDKVIEWLFGGDTGTSSKALAAAYLSVENKSPHGDSPPSDPSDLGRCLRLIELVPEVRCAVDTLALKHSGWARIAKVWDAIAQSMADEVGIHWEKGSVAPLTYMMMREARA